MEERIEIMGRRVAQTQMKVGVRLRTEIVDEQGTPCDVVRTGGALRSTAFNLGVISLTADLSTETIGGAVTDRHGSDRWTLTLILAAYAGTKAEEEKDMKLKVLLPDSQVAFRTIATVQRLEKDPSVYGTGYYVSDPLDILAKTDAP